MQEAACYGASPRSPFSLSALHLTVMGSRSSGLWRPLWTRPQCRHCMESSHRLRQVYLQFTGGRGSPKWALGPHSPDAQLSLVLLFSCSQLDPTLGDLMDYSTPGFPLLHQLPGLAQTHVRVGDAIQPSRPLSPPSPPTFNLAQHQGLFQRVGSLYQVAKVRSFSFGPSSEYSGLISFRTDCFDLLAVQGTLSSAQYCLALSRSLRLSGPWFVHLIRRMGAVRAFFSWVHRFLRGPWKG